MTTFNIKQINVPLFGVVENPNQVPWHTAFAGTGNLVPVSIDTTALDFIADELELEATDLIAGAERYVQGHFRSKARGLGGSQLGDFGEVLTFVINRAVPGREILRVFSWRPGASPVAKGSRFPQPDFIVRDNGQLSALEVKSTEAFNYQDLLPTRRWTWLQPCSYVSPRRDEALQQLGYSGQTLTPQQHSLEIQNGMVVPFPVSQGRAVVVLAHDGRVSALRNDSRYKTPPDCRGATPPRDCWSCVAKGHDAVVVSMPNMPGWLSLGDDGKGEQGHWFRAYQRWTQALRTREMSAAQRTSSELATAVNAWLEGERPERDGQILRAFWGSYLGDALRHHGLNVELGTALPDLGKVAPAFNWEPVPMTEPPVREGSMEELQRALAEGPEKTSTRWFSTRVPSSEGSKQETETLALGLTEQAIVFNFVSRAWWHGRELERDEEASQVAARIVSLAQDLWRGNAYVRHPQSIPLRRIVVRVGDREILFGWKPETSPDGWWRRWEQLLWADAHFWPYQDPSWYGLLAHDDSRVRLRVHRDGRADLRVLRSVWPRLF
ncbi:hypothetical protein [Hyalangium rubrum]|uniref:YqaJ viral recombinase domain-containing protein n=1 Tax=Hyalangium rubrum TaxID=3103134 RepID=A0ABU5H0M1_9BACT|nr:hypothetical protein [Hyalangium sp. s54d21]MDY7226984.1 hypothetical protein [Hyalangium sp. s54d21]